MHSEYDPLAAIYDAHWSFFIRRGLPTLERLLIDQLPPRAAVLDLCCGTGELARVLVQRGFDVTGLDASEGMLTIARSKVPDATFLLADARAFDLASSFDAVVSTFDSLNHVMSVAELRSVFANVRESLRPGGRFVFDLNLRAGFIDRWKGDSAHVTDRAALFTRASFDPETGIGRAEFTVFQPERECWSRRDTVLLQQCHPEADVLAALEEVGFANVGVEVQPVGSRLGGRGFFYGSRPAAA